MSDLRYTWRKLLTISNETSEELGRVQMGFKKDLVANVKALVVEIWLVVAAAFLLDAIHRHVDERELVCEREGCSGGGGHGGGWCEFFAGCGGGGG